MLKNKLPLFGLALLLSAAPSSWQPVYGRARALAAPRVNTLDGKARTRLNAALRELRKRGLRPRVNSTFRSQADQRAIYRCARSRRCRNRRGIYGANPPGSSLHEAGLAVDLGGIAAGRRKRRLTPKGRQTVRVMERHGFNWRYGLKDPAHFEISPQHAGYRSTQAAINAGQQRWRKAQQGKRGAPKTTQRKRQK
ncbi:MAG: D-alanyl-D-alanine carboxypeptidase family protein [Acidobacteria bacterium]|nr:D-alanyl-D-alanine carboxypeptidase family protein [Acidobacteriota bacterium]MBI3423511.1 D-alanyl-D-alanine carboxypeptidase family protein [Acidobacteriota bacterium]